MAKKKEIKPISVALAAVILVVTLLLIGAFVVYLVSKGDGGDTQSDISIEQSFDESSNDPPPVEVVVKETMADAEVGDAVVFGRFEQNGNTDDGAEPIEWIVLEKQDDKILLISRYALEKIAYNDDGSAAEFESSTLFAFLNGNFYDNAFNETERASLVGEDNKKVTMLDVEQAKKYYEYDSWRACAPSEMVNQSGARVENGACWWWLVDKGNIKDSASYVHFDGSIRTHGFATDYDLVAVRPVIWVKADTEQEDVDSSDVSDDSITESSEISE